MNFQTQFLGFLFILICSLSSAQTVDPADTTQQNVSQDTLKPRVPKISPEDSLKSVKKRQAQQEALSDSIKETFQFPTYEVSGDTIKPISTESTNPDIDNMLNFAKNFLGVPYRWGGTTPSGFDCSGFIYYIMGNFGFSIVRTSFSMSEMGRTVKLSDAKKGDLMFFKGRSLSSSRVGHVGMVYDVKEDGIYIIHSSSSRGVVIENFSKSRYLIPRYLKLKRLDYGQE